MHLLRGRMQIPTCPSAQKVLAVTQECGQIAWAHKFLPACLPAYSWDSVLKRGFTLPAHRAVLFEFAFFKFFEEECV